MKLLLLLILSVPVFAQDDENKEGFDNLPKGTIRKEVACFSTFGEKEKNNTIKPGITYLLPAGQNSMKMKRENITATIQIKSFVESENKITRNTEGYIVKINDKHVFGMDYDVKPPSTVMHSVMVTIEKDTVRLPKRAFDNLFQPGLCGDKGESPDLCPHIYISADKRRIYIFSMHGDGACAYEVTWIIQDKKYLRRIVDYGY